MLNHGVGETAQGFSGNICRLPQNKRHVLREPGVHSQSPSTHAQVAGPSIMSHQYPSGQPTTLQSSPVVGPQPKSPQMLPWQ
jgi:hypothetical protein